MKTHVMRRAPGWVHLSSPNPVTSARRSRCALRTPEDTPRLRAYAVARLFRCTRRVPPRCHRAELEDPCQPYLAAVAQHADCMHRLSASGVQRQGALDARAKLAGPAGKEDEERDEKRLSKADRTARPTSSATFSTLSVMYGWRPRCKRNLTIS